jgi:hypothetical protein
MNVDTCSLAPGMKRMAGPSQRPSNRIFVPRMREYGQSFMRALTGDNWIIDACATTYRHIDVRGRTWLPCNGVVELTLSVCMTRCKRDKQRPDLTSVRRSRAWSVLAVRRFSVFFIETV